MEREESKQLPTGRVALVTGGARRIGASVVRALADRGYSVAIHANRALSEAREMARLLELEGVPSLAVTANMREEGPVRAMVHRVADHFGRIDALVTCSGRCDCRGSSSALRHQLRRYVRHGTRGRGRDGAAGQRRRDCDARRLGDCPSVSRLFCLFSQ